MSAVQMVTPEVEPRPHHAMKPAAVEPLHPVPEMPPPVAAPPAGDVATRAKMTAVLQQNVGNARAGEIATKEKEKEPEALPPAAKEKEKAPEAPPPAAKEKEEKKPAEKAEPSADKEKEKAPAAKKEKGEGKGEGKGEEKAAAPSPRQAIGPAVQAVQQRAAGARKHAPPGGLVASAQSAAIDPKAEQTRGAAVGTVTQLDSAEKKEVRADDFKKKLREAIDAATPKPTSEAEANRVMKNGAKDASAALHGSLATERDAAAGPIKNAAAAEVPPSAVPAPEKGTMQAEPVGPAPAPVSAAPVVPAPLPAERLDYSSDRGETDTAMADASVTTEQLEKGNEPQFNKTLSERSSAEKHEAAAEATYRKTEAGVQSQTEKAAQGALAKELGGIHGVRTLNVGKVTEQQNATKAKDAQERQRITDTINDFKDKTRADVGGILSFMEGEAARIFDSGLKDAEAAYNAAFEEAKGGLGTWLTTWGDDWTEHIEQSLATARRVYMEHVDQAIDRVAKLVDDQLAAAKKRVADGRQQVEDFVKGLDDSVRAFGDEALKQVSGDFDAMGSEIDDRRDALVNKLTEQYKASYERMSAREEELREANKSLWQRVYDATVGVIKKILAFKDMLLNVLAKAAEVVMDIITDPIGFLGNLVSAVMRGLESFMANIGEHLRKGLMEWLFGALAGAGLQLPETFDLKGIISIVLQVLGLTYANFRKRAVAIVGEPVVAALEEAAEVFKIVMTEGVPGLWRFIQEKLEDLKSMVMDAIFDFIKERVLMAGVTWIIGLLNPASAFFKACKAIYDIVKFFIERGSQILALVNAIVDSIAAIAKGSLDTAAKWVENALAKAIPVAIGFLAALLGLGDISGTIRKTIEKAQEPVNNAIDWVIGMAVKGVKTIGKLLAGGGKKKEVEKKEEADKRPETDDPLHDAKVNAGIAALDERGNALLHDGGTLDRAEAEKVAASVQKDFPIFKSIAVVQGKETWDYQYVASSGKVTGEKVSDADVILRIEGKIMERPSWRPKTAEAIPISEGEDRRHIDAWQVLHTRMVLELNGKLVREGYDYLTGLGYKPARRRTSEVLEAARECLRDQFNNLENVRAGPSKENQQMGRDFAAAKKRADKALETGDRAVFEANIEILERLWRDPDPTGQKKGFENFTAVTILMLRKKFDERWGKK